MYARNNASPERIAIGQVILIADGTVQTSGVSITVRPQAGAEAAGGGTTAYGADGTVYYTPTQAETNYTSFVVIAYKASCFSVSQTIITTASATTGTVDVYSIGGTAQTANDNGADINTILSRIIGTLAAGTHNPASAAQIAVLSDWIDAGRLDAILDAVTTELAKVPKSDGTVSHNATALAAITADIVGDAVIAELTTQGDTNEALITAVDTVVDAIAADLANGTDGLGALKALIDTIDTVVDAVKAKTDSLTFTVANKVDANTKSINDVTITGDGNSTPFDV